MVSNNVFLIEIKQTFEKSQSKGYGPRPISNKLSRKSYSETYVLNVDSDSMVEVISIFREKTGYLGPISCTKSDNKDEDLAAFNRDKNELKYGNLF